MSTAQESVPIGEATLIRRTASVLTAEIDKQIVMMDIESGRYLGLDDIGSVIWKRLETPRTLGDLVDSLVEDYDAERAVIAQDVRELLKEMATQGIVSFD
jgi:imidazolonepropionase-like amidohydrolase